MKTPGYIPNLILSFYSAIEDGNYGNENSSVICFVTKYAGNKPQEQHLLNTNDVPDIIEFLNDTIKSSGSEKYEKKISSAMKVELYNRTVYMYKNDMLGVSAMWLFPASKVLTTHGRNSREYLKWPDMLFLVVNKIMHVFHVFKHNDTDSTHVEARYSIANIPNVEGVDKHICLGNANVNTNDQRDMSVNQYISNYENAFFNSRFTSKIKVGKNKNVLTRIFDNKLDFYRLLTLKKIISYYGK